MCWKVDTPRQSSCGHQNLDVFVSKQILNQRTVNSGHSSVVYRKAIRQQILELQVLNKTKQKTKKQTKKRSTKLIPLT